MLTMPEDGEYQAQDRSSNCGPVALFNMLIWLKEEPDIYKLETLTKCDIEYGTSNRNMTKSLKSLGIKFFQKPRPTLRDLGKWLDKGYAVIYLYAPNRHSGHYVFFDQHTKKSFRVANEVAADHNISVTWKPKTYYSYNSRRKKCGIHHRTCYPRAWVIKGQK